MAKQTSILKGAAFEWFIRRLLISCGFKQVQPDDILIFKQGAGLMIHGLGQAHNADVLVEPPFQIPFYFPSRLLVECKCLAEKADLPVLRNILGLREDINNFELVTPTILKARRNYRRTTRAIYNLDRHLYQIALASSAGFNLPAQEFAATHRIPLISVTKIPLYQTLLGFINSIDDKFCNNLGKNYKNCVSFFRGNAEAWSNYTKPPDEISSFINASENILKNSFVGILENGDIILFYCIKKLALRNVRVDIPVEIHYSKEKRYWIINKKGNMDDWQLIFELPERIYDEWANTEFSKYVAIDLKEKRFKKIYLFGKIDGVDQFVSLKLDGEFIKKARMKLDQKIRRES